jgi:integrase
MRLSRAVKTPASRDTVPLGIATIQALTAHRTSTHAADGDIVFPDPETGEFLRQSQLDRFWADVKRRSGLAPPRLRFHDLRHTYGSTLLAAGMNVVQVSKRMRHSKVSITLDVYAHELGQELGENPYDAWLEGEAA